MLHFLRCIGQAIVNHHLRVMAGLVRRGEPTDEIARDILKLYRLERRGTSLRTDVEQMMQASAEVVRADSHEIAGDMLVDRAPEHVSSLAQYLIQVPVVARQSLHHIETANGTTVPTHVNLFEASLLGQLLPKWFPSFETVELVSKERSPNPRDTPQSTPHPAEPPMLLFPHGSHQIGDVIELPLFGSVRMKFAWVPPGTSWLGGGDGFQGSKSFTIQHGLWCGIYPVTQAEWRAVMDDNPSRFHGNPLHPVESVSSDRIAEFLARANQPLGKIGLRYRLPKKDEWEYICRGGPIAKDQSQYNYYLARSKNDLTPAPTNDLSSFEANFDGNYPGGCARKGPNRDSTTEVGSFLPNPLGIYDLHGNVYEWVRLGGSDDFVIRGGGWGSSSESCTAGYFCAWSGGKGTDILGFRILAIPIAEDAP